MKLGDKLEQIFERTGIKKAVKYVVEDVLGYDDCGCEARKEKLNNIKLHRRKWTSKTKNSGLSSESPLAT